MKKVLHVHENQEDETPYASLPIDVQLNADCDHCAKDCMQHYNENGDNAEPTPGCGAALFLGDNLVTT